MAEHFPLLVPGGVATGDPERVVSPYDGTEIATVERAGPDAVEQALTTAWSLYRDRDAWLSPATRIRVLENTIAIMKERRDELALEAAREGGKPLIDSKVEVHRAIDSVRICIDELRSRSGRMVPMNINPASAGKLAFTQYEPVGPVVAFSAFNHPLNLIAHQVAPAVATGCPIIVKPAETTPLSCMRFVGILREAGLPEEWCQALLTADHDVSGRLLADERVGFFSFIGSAAVGWMLRGRLAAGTRCALEHGGAAPVLVADDADLDGALPPLVKGGFYHAGQVCVSVQRVFAARRVARQVADRLAEMAALLKVGDPTEPETEVGPLIRAREVERVGEWVEEAQGEGAEVLTGGEMLSESCYAPTVLWDPPVACRVSTQEIFGPVICVYPYDELDQAIAIANDLPYSFQAAVFTRDLELALRASRRLDASAVMVNEHTAFRVDWMPFAGLRQSGLGTGGIPYTMDDMRVEKMTVIQSPELGYGQ